MAKVKTVRRKKVVDENDIDEMVDDVLEQPDEAMQAHEPKRELSKDGLKNHPKFDKFKSKGK